MALEHIKNMLILEDDDKIIQILKAFLAVSNDISVKVADGVPIAVNMLREERFDLISVDRDLGYSRGEHIIPFVRRVSPSTRILCCSSQIRDPNLDFDSYLEKAISFAEFQKVLAKLDKQYGEIQALTDDQRRGYNLALSHANQKRDVDLAVRFRWSEDEIDQYLEVFRKFGHDPIPTESYEGSLEAYAFRAKGRQVCLPLNSTVQKEVLLGSAEYLAAHEEKHRLIEEARQSNTLVSPDQEKYPGNPFSNLLQGGVDYRGFFYLCEETMTDSLVRQQNPEVINQGYADLSESLELSENRLSEGNWTNGVLRICELHSFAQTPGIETSVQSSLLETAKSWEESMEEFLGKNERIREHYDDLMLKLPFLADNVAIRDR